MGISLFSYGTLQQPEVQPATCGRLLTGVPNALQGYRLAPLAITDPHVVAVSGKAVHHIACATGNADDRLPGMVFELSESELEATDAYEVDVYARVEVTLHGPKDGQSDWG